MYGITGINAKENFITDCGIWWSYLWILLDFSPMYMKANA